MQDVITLMLLEKFKRRIEKVEKSAAEKGPQGPKGDKGADGKQGPKGPKGPEGPKGPKGPEGPKGSDGKEGADGEAGVGIVDAYTSADGDLVFVMSDDSEVSVEMPLETDKEGNTVVLSQGGSGGDSDLSGYVKRPVAALRDGKWLLYRELPDGTREWAPATTDLIETNGMLMFRDIKGRFTPTPEEFDELNNQLKVNRFIWEKIQELDLEYATLEHSDGRDDALQLQIDELEQEIDVIAPRLEAAQYKYVSAPTVKPGEMFIASGTFTAATDVVFFNDTALDGVTHAWGSLHEGDYLEITDTQEKNSRTAENYAMYLVTKEPEGTGMKQIEVSLVKGHGAPAVDDILDAKAFQLGGNDINDLDARYALKNHTHDELEGGVIITPLEFLRLSGGQYVSDDAIKGLTSGGSATSGSAHGLDIPWKWFENNYPDIIGWVDDGGQARHGGRPANLTVNKGGSRPGLTVMGPYALSYADVVIPGFVIRVDKIEEPQWGHKWPEKEGQ